MAVPVEITDEFTEPYGEFNGYSAILKEQNEALRGQKHVDIRSFVPDTPSSQVTMLLMDRLTMFYLDGEPAEQWSSTVKYHPGDVIEIGSIKYLSIKESEGVKPPNAEYWQATGQTGGEIGRYTSDTTPPAHVVVIDNEHWSFGTVGPQADRNNWNGISVPVPANTEVATQSVITFNEH